jgi:hypothetical protein
MSNSDSPLPQKRLFLVKNRIFMTFRFNTQYAFSESGKRFFASKMSNSDSPHVSTPRGVISRKNFQKFFHVGSPLLCSSYKTCIRLLTFLRKSGVVSPMANSSGIDVLRVFSSSRTLSHRRIIRSRAYPEVIRPSGSMSHISTMVLTTCSVT